MRKEGSGLVEAEILEEWNKIDAEEDLFHNWLDLCRKMEPDLFRVHMDTYLRSISGTVVKGMLPAIVHNHGLPLDLHEALRRAFLAGFFFALRRWESSVASLGFKPEFKVDGIIPGFFSRGGLDPSDFVL